MNRTGRMQSEVRAAVPIRRRKLYEEVASRIEEMIHVGRFSPGDRLPSEKEIMEELGVGRSAVREAMLSLQKMGLVTVRSGERARVTTPTANVLVHELSGAARLLLAQEGGVAAIPGGARALRDRPRAPRGGAGDARGHPRAEDGAARTTRPRSATTSSSCGPTSPSTTSSRRSRRTRSSPLSTTRSSAG